MECDLESIYTGSLEAAAGFLDSCLWPDSVLASFKGMMGLSPVEELGQREYIWAESFRSGARIPHCAIVITQEMHTTAVRESLQFFLLRLHHQWFRRAEICSKLSQLPFCIRKKQVISVFQSFTSAVTGSCNTRFHSVASVSLSLKPSNKDI